LGVGGGEFGVGEGAEEGEDAADDPDEEGVADGTIELAEDQAGSEEDTGADDGTDEEEKEVALAEGAEESGHWGGMIAEGGLRGEKKVDSRQVRVERKERGRKGLPQRAPREEHREHRGVGRVRTAQRNGEGENGTG